MNDRPPPHLDQDKLDELRSLNGPDDEDFFGRLVASFLRDARRRVDEIDQGLEAGDQEAVTMAAHALKGSSLYVGIVRLGTLCHSLQELSGTGEVDRSVAVAGQIREELETVSGLLSQ